MTHDVHIIGGGLAGSEAAWQLARRGVRVRLSEMRGGGGATPAHQTDGLAELVCSNSFRSDDTSTTRSACCTTRCARLDSLVMRAGEVARVPGRLGDGGRPRRVLGRGAARAGGAAQPRDRARDRSTRCPTPA